MKKVLLNGLKFFILPVLFANNINTQHAISATTIPNLTFNLGTCFTLDYYVTDQKVGISHFSAVFKIKESVKEIILCPSKHFQKKWWPQIEN